MFIDEKYSVSLWNDGLTTGCQPKYHKDGYWYKVNQLGNEGLAEELSSLVLEHSSNCNHVKYEQVKIGEKSGCVSANFLEKDEHFVTYRALYKNLNNRNLSDDIIAIQDPEKRFNFLVNFIKEATDLDPTEYLQHTFALDMLIKNPDRHFGNLGVILKPDGTFREAPIFDNGQGLYQNFQITPPLMEDEDKDEALHAATICGSFERQYLVATEALEKIGGAPLKIDFDLLEERISSYPDSIAKRCLLQQMGKYRSVLEKNGMPYEK